MYIYIYIYIYIYMHHQPVPTPSSEVSKGLYWITESFSPVFFWQKFSKVNALVHLPCLVAKRELLRNSEQRTFEKLAPRRMYHWYRAVALRVHLYTHRHTHTHTHTYIHTRARAHTHTFIHTCTRQRVIAQRVYVQMRVATVHMPTARSSSKHTSDVCVSKSLLHIYNIHTSTIYMYYKHTNTYICSSPREH